MGLLTDGPIQPDGPFNRWDRSIRWDIGNPMGPFNPMGSGLSWIRISNGPVAAGPSDWRPGLGRATWPSAGGRLLPGGLQSSALRGSDVVDGALHAKHVASTRMRRRGLLRLGSSTAVIP
jgi:hypothetical protein